MKLYSLPFIIIFYLVLSFRVQGQTTYFVDATVVPSGDGSHWTTAFNDLQSALDLATTGDQIWVAKGIYYPTTTDDRNISFNISDGVEMYGGLVGTEDPTTFNLEDRDFITNETILSGDIGTPDDKNDNSYTIIYTQQVSSATTVNGFTITKGNANGSTAIGTRTGSAGGWYNDGGESGNVSSPRISHCIFKDNTATFAGALFNDGRNEGIANPILESCSFMDNEATANAGALLNFGHTGTSSPFLTNCTFSNNIAADFGGAIINNGFSGTSLAEFVDCTFTNNQAENNGGTIFNMGANGKSSPLFTNCLFNASVGRNGGTLYNLGTGGESNPIFTNCTFTASSGRSGGVMFNDGIGGISSPIYTDCTFTDNHGSNNGGVLFNCGVDGASNPQLMNCSFQNNVAAVNGGALYSIGNNGMTAARLVNCLFSNNEATLDGGVLAYDDSTIESPHFINCTFYDNRARLGGVIAVVIANDARNSPVLDNCIAWNNSSTVSNLNGVEDVAIHHTIIQETDCPPGAICNNVLFNADPLFKDADNGDYQLLANSPCIDAGNNTADIDGDIGEMTIADVATDLNHNIRLIDGNADMTPTEWGYWYTK